MKVVTTKNRLYEETELSDQMNDIFLNAERLSNDNDLSSFSNAESNDKCNIFILNFICKLEGYRIRFREYHWSAKTMTLHKLCDDIMSSLLDYEDQIAEEFQGNINYRIQPGTIRPILIEDASAGINKTLQILLTDIIAFKKQIKNCGDDNYDGMLNIIDDMIHKINTFKYLGTFD